MVRPAANSDLGRICLLNDPSIPWLPNRERLEDVIAAGGCLVVEDEDNLIGYGCMDYRFFKRGFVWLVFVSIHHRRRGCASKLFDVFEAQCRSKRIFTSTNLSNLPMQALLNSRKYVLSGVVQDLDEGDPELFYSAQIR